MSSKRRNHSEIKIDESKMVAETSTFRKFLNALYAIVLGVVLVQAFFFFIGSFSGRGSVVALFDNPLYLLFLGVCAILGWFAGDNFIVWLKEEISVWKFW